MFRRILSISLAGLLLQAVICTNPALANPKTDKDAKFAQKVKEGISKLGVGQEAQVRVTLRDRTKIAGYISRAQEDSFVIADSKTGLTTTVAYADVAQVQGQNPSRHVHIGWAIAILVAILVVAVVVSTK